MEARSGTPFWDPGRAPTLPNHPGLPTIYSHGWGSDNGAGSIKGENQTRFPPGKSLLKKKSKKTAWLVAQEGVFLPTSKWSKARLSQSLDLGHFDFANGRPP